MTDRTVASLVQMGKMEEIHVGMRVASLFLDTLSLKCEEQSIMGKSPRQLKRQSEALERSLSSSPRAEGAQR